MKVIDKDIDIVSFIPRKGKDIITIKGREFVKKVGLETVREVIHDVLCGENIRDSTEIITRKRISLANGSLIIMFLEAGKKIDNFFEDLPRLASKRLKQGKLKREERWMLNWIIGLTDKAVQNILRDDPKKIDDYTSKFKLTIDEASKELKKEFGELTCQLYLNKDKPQKLDWKGFNILMAAIGSQTLTLRGSEKSTYGKLFERLVLGSILHILGFNLVDPKSNKKLHKIFWLSQQEDKRESDATLIYKPGKGIRFDIGFIGRGNPEISLDKVSRFERELEHGRQKHYMATIIIVDRIGKNSGISQMAKKIGGTIVQMSMSYWVIDVAKKLKEVIGYDPKILHIKEEKIPEYIRKKMQDVPIEKFLNH